MERHKNLGMSDANHAQGKIVAPTGTPPIRHATGVMMLSLLAIGQVQVHAQEPVPSWQRLADAAPLEAGGTKVRVSISADKHVHEHGDELTVRVEFENQGPADLVVFNAGFRREQSWPGILAIYDNTATFRGKLNGWSGRMALPSFHVEPWNWCLLKAGKTYWTPLRLRVPATENPAKKKLIPKAGRYTMQLVMTDLFIAENIYGGPVSNCNCLGGQQVHSCWIASEGDKTTRLTEEQLEEITERHNRNFSGRELFRSNKIEIIIRDKGAIPPDVLALEPVEARR